MQWLLCRVLYEGAAYMAVLKNFLCLFYYLRIIRRVDYQAEITGSTLLKLTNQKWLETNQIWLECRIDRWLTRI